MVARPVRPERLRFVAPEAGVLAGRIESANYLGGQIIFRIEAANGLRLLVKQAANGGGAAIGSTVSVAWNAADAVVLAD